MKTSRYLVFFFVAALLLAGCRLSINGKNVKLIEPSKTIITEERSINGFTGINFSTFGKVILIQGSTKSLTIHGSDNIVPLVKSSVQGGILTLRMDEGVNVSGMNDETVLTFTITVKDLNKLAVSGAGKFTMDTLSTTDLDVTMSGAGQVLLNNLTAESLKVNLSGVGDIEIDGQVTTATIVVSGAGPVNAPDLKIQTADVTISGLGSATLWVTDRLTGTISGAGNVSYYGNPQANTNASGLGHFEALGNK